MAGYLLSGVGWASLAGDIRRLLTDAEMLDVDWSRTTSLLGHVSSHHGSQSLACPHFVVVSVGLGWRFSSCRGKPSLSIRPPNVNLTSRKKYSLPSRLYPLSRFSSPDADQTATSPLGMQTAL